MANPSAPASVPDKPGMPHRLRLLVGRAICWFTDPVNEERRRAISLPDIAARPAVVIPENVDPAHLPLYTSGRRPPFFYDAPVRDRLIACLHRMTIDQAKDLCIAEFGRARTPSRSAIHRFWRALDQCATAAAPPTSDREPLNPWQPQPKGRIERAIRLGAKGGAA